METLYCLTHTLQKRGAFNLLVVPHKSDSLRWVMQFTHRKYAEYVNALHGWSGHLWQQRFYSSPVDEEFFWLAARYIERNPVEAGIVKNAADYLWSSADSHSCGKLHALSNPHSKWTKKLLSRRSWSSWINKKLNQSDVDFLCQTVSRDLPCGSESFLRQIEENYGQDSRLRPVGRPQKIGTVVTDTIKD